MEQVLLLCALLVFVASLVNAEVHFHEFIIQETPVKRLCRVRNSITVNGQFPGPTLEVRNDDSLVITAINKAQYNISLHWHGIRQMRNPWADGPEFITQCPIKPGGSLIYHYVYTLRGRREDWKEQHCWFEVNRR
ncbi:Laccase-13 [Raphanus sativus]|nr:Laccase-13 [Raphanus sativus]